ncbi:MAG: TerB family tellurite resistance protein [Limnoraphis robusta]|uniref:Branched-chain amino acid ABC transporter ATP-binding protein n=2 Tax=Limnoraphis robusta TaxID=1118279 RepID=A0A0F5Y912_9CYAN|nr:TerB family tellurite resistance protein [Limnoraphis robusta]KKD35097.1 branched-chain amino acid ABC transporter ATP-binding protein [Limnoraphis robusta CS-951]MEA5497180.1 TerB family tellurite resistance protein [Limnoraphis robusta BA-68 BA1]MEA5521774.1 TerB family tellurite resistance protein [Limnoraphis robusta CCNP1315]MEA5537681.1 TerB family tellurite resistance protein [Limnoraphis robusta Tam1]MEA5546130.1 TerB family tellurite resistance protein [Limnoraphis robusta CCNP1324
MQAPPPPPITPRQMNLLRVVTAMAWADGHLAQEEVALMLDEFSRLFAVGTEQEKLQQELTEYLMQNIPLEELIPKLKTQEERELVLRLGYEVIGASARTPDEPNINEDEAAAYQKLVKLLDLPEDVVKTIEAEVEAKPTNDPNVVARITKELGAFVKGEEQG